jgi:hypothetical protein
MHHNQGKSKKAKAGRLDNVAVSFIFRKEEKPVEKS